MASVPSIKGTAFTKVVEDVAKLMATQALSRSEAERWLQPDDFAVLEREVQAARWYDIRVYERMSRLLLDVEGHGDTSYLRERGRQTAKRLLGAGVYAQLEYLQRTEASRERDPLQRFEALGRDLRLLNTLSASILNFSKWNHVKEERHARRYRIEVSEAAAFPEVLCWTTDGFVNGMAEHGTGSLLWRWDRPKRDLVVFRMTTDI
jgi:hypothetical protein